MADNRSVNFSLANDACVSVQLVSYLGSLKLLNMPVYSSMVEAVEFELASYEIHY